MKKITLLLFAMVSLYLQQASAQNGSPYWSLTGNSNGTTAAPKLGTTNSIPLNLTTNNITRLRIGTDGKVGIGTTSPVTRFHVAGFGSFGNRVTTANATRALNLADTAAVMRILRVDRSSAPAVELISRTTADGANVAYWDMYAQPSDKSFRIRDRQTGANLDRLTIDHANGYVGIGTTAPAYKLDVEDTVSNAAIYATSTGYYGVYGIGGSYGIYGTSDYVGLYGSGSTYGMYAYGSSYGAFGSGNYGVYGSGTTYGVYGYAYSTDKSGVRGEGTYAFGVSGNSSYNYGGYFTSTNLHGIYAKTSNSNPSAYAAVFQGNTYCYGTYSTSDERVKKNITDFKSGLAMINQLKPKTYEFISDGKFANLDLPKGDHFGLLAQDVEKLFPGLVREAPLEVQKPEAIVARKTGSATPDTAAMQQRVPQPIETVPVKAINYTELIPVMIKGMQELDEENKDLKKQVAGMQDEVAQLKQLVRDLSSRVNGATTDLSLSDASLQQNQPNPFASKTVVPLSVPANAKHAVLTITETGSGKVIKTITVAPGFKQISVDANLLASGSYTYTLTVDGKKVDSRQMTVLK